MSMLVKIAWRNVWRSRTRSLIVISSIAVGVWALLAGTGFMNGFLVSYMTEAINHDISNLQVHNPEYSEDNDVNYFIPNSDEKAEKLNQIPGVVAVTKRVLVNGMIQSAKKATGVEVCGINTVEEANVTRLDSLITEGAYFEGVKRNPVVIGSKLAEELGVKIRSKVVITFSDAEGEMISGAFRVVGILKTSSIRLNQLTAFVKSSDIQPLVGVGDNYHEMAAVTDGTVEDSVIVSQYQLMYPEDLSEDWRLLSPSMAMMTDMYGNMLYILMAVILIALVFGIINTMLMAVLERMKEIGMLMAIGMNKTKVFSMIVLETVYLGLVGTPIGLLLGYLHINYYQKRGVDLSAYSEGLEAFGYSSDLFPYLDNSVYFIVSFGVFVTALLGSLYPARKAIKLKPVETLHKL